MRMGVPAGGNEEMNAHTGGGRHCRLAGLLTIGAILMTLGACNRSRSGRAQQKSDEVFRQSPALQDRRERRDDEAM